MARTSTGFGTRQGGLPQTYRPGVSARAQVKSPTPTQTFSPPSQQVLPRGELPKVNPLGGSENVYALRNPVLLRWVSGAIDLIILMIMTWLVMLAFDVFDGGLSGGKNPALLEDGTLTLVVAAMWFGYGILFESSGLQGTPGKILTGLVVTDMSGQKMGFGKTFGRACGKVFSTLVPFYIPYIMVGITERKQSLHDKMCGTLVFRRRDLATSSAVFD